MWQSSLTEVTSFLLKGADTVGYYKHDKMHFVLWTDVSANGGSLKTNEEETENHKHSLIGVLAE